MLTNHAWALGVALMASGMLSPTALLAQGKRFATGLAFAFEQEIASPAALLAVLGYPFRSLLPASSSWHPRLALGLGIAPDESRQRDVPYGHASLGVRKDLVRFEAEGVSSRIVIGFGADAGVEYAAVFDTIFSAAPFSTAALVGRRGIWIPVARGELSARFTLGNPDTPAALIWTLGYLDRLTAGGREIGLRSRFFTGTGLEIWIP